MGRPKGSKWTEEQKEKARVAHTGLKYSDEHRKAISMSSFGKKMPLSARIAKSGSRHPNWKGGLDRLAEAIRRLPESYAWSKKVFEKDGYRCCKCGCRGKLSAHHKKAFGLLVKEFLEFYNQFSWLEDREILIRLAITWVAFWDIKNGGSLCDRCHKEFHSIYGCEGSNTVEQWDEYVSIKQEVC